jgi:hypothetical protein
MRKEIKNLKKALYAYQIMAKLPNGISSNGPLVSNVYHRCLHCEKVFTAHSFLEAHLRRRHPGMNNEEEVDEEPEPAKPDPTPDMLAILSQKLLESEQKLKCDLEGKLNKDIESRQVPHLLI